MDDSHEHKNDAELSRHMPGANVQESPKLPIIAEEMACGGDIDDSASQTLSNTNDRTVHYTQTELEDPYEKPSHDASSTEAVPAELANLAEQSESLARASPKMQDVAAEDAAIPEPREAPTRDVEHSQFRGSGGGYVEMVMDQEARGLEAEEHRIDGLMEEMIEYERRLLKGVREANMHNGVVSDLEIKERKQSLKFLNSCFDILDMYLESISASQNYGCLIRDHMVIEEELNRLGGMTLEMRQLQNRFL